MKPIVSIIMGSTSDLPVMEKAAKFLDEMEVPFEINALSAHRTPAEVEQFAGQARERGIHLIWIPHDVMDPRTVSRREMREAFNQYMITVLREEPLDPTLLDYEDARSW